MIADWPIWPIHPSTPTWDPFGGPLTTTQIHYPQILSAEELEMLEPLIQRNVTTLPAILRAKLAHPTGAFSDMKTYLLRFSKLPEVCNDRLAGQFEAIVEEVREIARYHAR